MRREEKACYASELTQYGTTMGVDIWVLVLGGTGAPLKVAGNGDTEQRLLQ
jgi:hypothetical protein